MLCGCSESFHHLWLWDCCGTKLVSSPVSRPCALTCPDAGHSCLGSRCDIRHREYPAVQYWYVNSSQYFIRHVLTDMYMFCFFVLIKCHWLLQLIFSSLTKYSHLFFSLHINCQSCGFSPDCTLDIKSPI